MPLNRKAHGALGLVAALALSSITLREAALHAQPALCATPKDGEGRSGPSLAGLRLFATWTEVENGWNGRWTPVGDRLGHFSASWARNGERVTADLQITATDSSHVQIIRTQPQGTCTYQGTAWPDGMHVSGTYTCSWVSGRPMQWSAAIARGYLPPRGCIDGAASPPDPRLTVIWREQEGDWSGTWTPVQPVGDFRAGWHKGREWTNADLHMTLAGDQITVKRSQGQGICTYTGAFTGNGWRAEGTYYCSWNHNRMPWKATIGDGAPPSS